MKITRKQLRQIIKENLASGRALQTRGVGSSKRDQIDEAQMDATAPGATLPFDADTQDELEQEPDSDMARPAFSTGPARKIAKLKDRARKKEYFYRLDGDILSAFNKETGQWTSAPDSWSLDQKIGTLNKDMQQPMRDMIADLNGANWNLRELGKYHHNDESGDLKPMPAPGTTEYEEFKRKAYTPGAEGAWAWKAKIHRGWRDHKTQAELKAAGPGASYSLHTVLDSEGQPSALAADVIDRRYAWGGPRAPQFWNALRIAAHSTGKLQIDIPVKDPAHVVHADYESTQARTLDVKTQEVMVSLKQELDNSTGTA